MLIQVACEHCPVQPVIVTDAGCYCCTHSDCNSGL